ncbi:MAG: sugar transferase [Solirubrobacterales bacterium]
MNPPISSAAAQTTVQTDPAMPALTALPDESIAWDSLEYPGSDELDANSAQLPSRRDALNWAALRIADLTAVAISVAVTLASSNVMVAWPVFFMLLLAVPICKVLDLYDRDTDMLHRSTYEETPRIVCAALLLALSAFVLRGALIDDNFTIATDHLALMTMWLVVSLAGARMTARAWVRHYTPPERVLMIGGDEDCVRLDNALAATPTLSAKIIDHVSTTGCTTESGLPLSVTDQNLLAAKIESLRIDRVVISPSGVAAGPTARLIHDIGTTGAKVSIQPQLFGMTRTVPLIEEVGAIKLVSLRQPRLSPASRRVKRVIDFVGTGVAVILCSPFLLLTALAIKLDSPGPVFYRQRRIGRDGEAFQIIKFRTMFVGAEASRGTLSHLNETKGLFKIARDPRVTSVGRLLRKTSIDELPQLFCVLKGDMSLVGPRPLVPEEDEMITGWRRHRNSVTPGMTGPWQLLGPVRVPINEMVELDYEYVNNWSIGNDLRILIQTVPHVLARRGL